RKGTTPREPGSRPDAARCLENTVFTRGGGWHRSCRTAWHVGRLWPSEGRRRTPEHLHRGGGAVAWCLAPNGVLPDSGGSSPYDSNPLRVATCAAGVGRGAAAVHAGGGGGAGGGGAGGRRAAKSRAADVLDTGPCARSRAPWRPRPLFRDDCAARL